MVWGAYKKKTFLDEGSVPKIAQSFILCLLCSATEPVVVRLCYCSNTVRPQLVVHFLRERISCLYSTYRMSSTSVCETHRCAYARCVMKDTYTYPEV